MITIAAGSCAFHPAPPVARAFPESQIDGSDYPQHYDRAIVFRLLGSREAALDLEEGGGDLVGRTLTGALQSPQQRLTAQLSSGNVARLGQSVGVKDDEVAAL